MQNDALNKIRQAETDHQQRIQAENERAADRIRQAASDAEVRLHNAETTLHEQWSVICADTEKEAADMREKAAADARMCAQTVRESAEKRMDTAIAYIVKAVLAHGGKTL